MRQVGLKGPPVHAQACTLHKEHPTSVAFFDETGAIASDRFFSVGLVRVEDHVKLLKSVKSLRKRYKYWDEFKWAGITDANKDIFKALLSLLVTADVKFSCFVADRHVADPVGRFGNTFAAYEKLATQLLIGSIRPYELVTVIADNYSAPNTRSFERTVRQECNNRLGRLAVTAVLQVDSKATEGLQLVDVLTGAVGFDFKVTSGLASRSTHKAEVAEHLLSLVGATTFNDGFTTGATFSVRLYEHDKWLKRQQGRFAPTARAANQEPQPSKAEATGSDSGQDAAREVASRPRKARRKRRGGRHSRSGQPGGPEA